MRILFVTHNFPRVPGDIPGNFLLRLAAALQAHGDSVHVIAPHAPGLAMDATVDGVTVSRFRYAPDPRETLAYAGTMAAQVRASPRAAGDLWRLIRHAARAIRVHAPQCDLVHAHWWFPAGLAANTRALGGRPLVTTLHGSDVRLARSAPARLLMRRVFRRSARVTAVSPWLAGEAARLASVPAPAVLPMPVDVALFAPGAAPREHVLFVGKLDAQKGAAVLVDALAKLPASVHATIIGDGPDAAALRARADALGVAPRVRWLGARAQHELVRHYQSARILVAPATAPEGLGLTAVEAMLCETPVVASRTGGLADVVADGETGRLVQPNDAAALASAIAAALSDPARLDAWGREGRRRVLERHDPGMCAARFRALYAEVVHAH